MSLTRDLRQWREDRNITKADYLVFVGNILEELMEPIWSKNAIEINKNEILENYFLSSGTVMNNIDIIDTIQDIQVFCINETELMGYDNERCNIEVFRHINCRRQDPEQVKDWLENGANGKWLKDKSQDPKEIYEPNYESCRL